MSFKDLREFVAFLEERGDLARISAQVSSDLEITEIADRVVKTGGPALLFENVAGYDMPVLINIFGSARRMGWALGVDDLDELGDRFRELLGLVQGPPEGIINKLRTLGQIVQLGSFSPRTVRSAPCQEVVLEGEDVDLYSLPILKCWPLDGGRYITLPLVISRDPETGIQNYGTYRLQVYDSRTTGMHWQTHKVGTRHYRLGQERGLQRMDVAVALGGDPVSIWTGSAPLPPDMDEMTVAGFLRKQAVELVKAKTSDLLVPAHAEIVLEGYIAPGEERVEGPFGDHTGYYSMEDEYPVFHVACITRRRAPDLPHHSSGASADGRLLDGQSYGTPVPPGHPDHSAGGSRHQYACGGHLPQPGYRIHQEGIPGPGQEGNARSLGARADESGQDHCRRRPFR